MTKHKKSVIMLINKDLFTISYFRLVIFVAKLLVTKITNLENMGMPKNLFLVRHGQSEGNLVRKKYEETGDESFFSDEFLGLHESQYQLTELGIEQAKLAGGWFKNNELYTFDRMIVSNNVRAMQTAAHLNLPNALWMQDAKLRERDGGLSNSITPSERDELYKNEQKFYDTQPFLHRPIQGESVADLCDRIKFVLDTLARECDGKNVIIVCHGHVIRAMRIVIERMSLRRTNEYLLDHSEPGRVPNCSIVHYTRDNPEKNEGLRDRFDWMRIVRPAGGGTPEDPFSLIVRKKFTNEDLLEEAKANRGI